MLSLDLQLQLQPRWFHQYALLIRGSYLVKKGPKKKKKFEDYISKSIHIKNSYHCELLNVTTVPCPAGLVVIGKPWQNQVTMINREDEPRVVQDFSREYCGYRISLYVTIDLCRANLRAKHQIDCMTIGFNLTICFKFLRWDSSVPYHFKTRSW